MFGGGKKVSGLQKQVFSLYRDFLRVAAKKPEPSASQLREYIRAEFRKNKAIHRFDTNNIEHRLRRGSRQLEALANSSVQGFHLLNNSEANK